MNDHAQRAKMWSHLHHERPILTVGSWRTQCQDVTHEVDDGQRPLASCSRTFVCTPTLWKFASECKDLCNEIDFANCEGIHNNLSKLNCRCHIAEKCVVAMIRGLRQALTRIGCLQAFESGPTVEELCPAEMADYDHVYYDNVTGASLPSKLCSWISST